MKDFIEKMSEVEMLWLISSPESGSRIVVSVGEDELGLMLLRTKNVPPFLLLSGSI